MKPVFQRYHTDVTRNEFGDCLRCCIASILELQLDDVPHFSWGIYDQTEGGGMEGHLRMWLRGRNIGLLVYSTKTNSLDEALAWSLKINPESYLILGGGNSSGGGHAVVVHQGKVVHNPAFPTPSNLPALAGPLHDGTFNILALEHRPVTQRDNVGLLGCGSLEGVEIPGPPDCSILEQHERIGFAFSGGKDSLAMLGLLRPHWHRLTVYHVDTQDLLPETRAVVAHAYSLTKGHVRGWRHILTNSIGWQEKFGLASDLVPFDCTDLGMALLHGAAGRMSMAPRMSCCSANLHRPLYEAFESDGVTLGIRGTRREDAAWGLLVVGGKPMTPDLYLDESSGLQWWCPIHDWSTAQVFAYLQREGLPIAKYYHDQYRHSGPECARCTAWLDEGRAKYLRQHHPALAGDYMVRLQRVRSAIRPTLAQLDDELDALTAP